MHKRFIITTLCIIDDQFYRFSTDLWEWINISHVQYVHTYVLPPIPSRDFSYPFSNCTYHHHAAHKQYCDDLWDDESMDTNKWTIITDAWWMKGRVKEGWRFYIPSTTTTTTIIITTITLYTIITWLMVVIT